MSLSAIIPNRNGSRTILDTLKSVYEQLPNEARVLVIDDRSTDGSVELIELNYPAVSLHINERSLGAAATRNQGLRHSQTTWLLFVDADVTLQPGCLGLLLRASQQADLVFPCIFYPNGSIMYPVTEFDASYPLVSPIFLLRRSALTRLSEPEFDERYQTYCEDTDFFLRCYLAGVEAKYVPEATAIHNVTSRPNNREVRYFLEVRNSIYGAIKFGGMPGIDRFDHAFKLSNILKVLVCGLFNFNLFDMQARGWRKKGGLRHDLGLLLHGHDRITTRSSAVLVYLALQAVLWNIRHLPQAWQSRKQTRQTR